MRMICKCRGFTLAEVLVTLGIIGVVAAMTLSAVISNYKKYVTANRLKHVYSVLKNAELLSIQENGDMRGWNFLRTDFVPTYYFPYLRDLKCNFHNTRVDIKSSKGVVATTITKGTKKVCLANGTMIVGYTVSGFHGAVVFVDLNGPKTPNILGKDVFMFLINRPIYKSSDYRTSSYYIVPKCPAGLSTCFPGNYHSNKGYYWNGDEESLLDFCTGEGLDDLPALVTKGNSCAYMIERAGWKFPDNYPIKL